MKLNPKCIRDTLIAIEEMSALDERLVPKKLTIKNFLENENTSKYSVNEIIYTLKKLRDRFQQYYQSQLKLRCYIYS